MFVFLLTKFAICDIIRYNWGRSGADGFDGVAFTNENDFGRLLYGKEKHGRRGKHERAF